MEIRISNCPQISNCLQISKYALHSQRCVTRKSVYIVVLNYQKKKLNYFNKYLNISFGTKWNICRQTEFYHLDKFVQILESLIWNINY